MRKFQACTTAEYTMLVIHVQNDGLFKYGLSQAVLTPSHYGVS